MVKFIKKTLLLLFFVCMMFFLICFSKITIQFASCGLLTWFHTMIPTLLPFMVFSSLLIKLGIHRSLMKGFSKLLIPIFRVNEDCIYCILFGFICGFPMGAKIATDLYHEKLISRHEFNYLLSFTNNIGPIYFISIVFQGIEPKYQMFFFLMMYFIPFIYGIFLRYTLFYHMDITNCVPQREQFVGEKTSLFDCLDDCMMSSLYNITRLGGYMILFNLLASIPYILSKYFVVNPVQLAGIHCSIEISSGIRSLLELKIPVLMKEKIMLPMVMFGGASCFAQTYSTIRELEISLFPYFIHKLIQTLCYLFLVAIIQYL